MLGQRSERGPGPILWFGYNLGYIIPILNAMNFIVIEENLRVFCEIKQFLSTNKYVDFPL